MTWKVRRHEPKKQRGVSQKWFKNNSVSTKQFKRFTSNASPKMDYTLVVKRPSIYDLQHCIKKMWPILQRLYPATHTEARELRMLLDDSILIYMIEARTVNREVGFGLVQMCNIEQGHL